MKGVMYKYRTLIGLLCLLMLCPSFALGSTKSSAEALREYAQNAIESDEYENASKYLLNALKKDEENGDLQGMQLTRRALVDVYTKMGNAKEAYGWYEEFHVHYDSLYKLQVLEQIAKLEKQYETEKQGRKIQLLKANELIQGAALSTQGIVNKTIIGGIVLALLLTFLVFGRYRIKKLLNDNLQDKNKTIEEQKGKIVSSINYASRIQQSIMVAESEIKKQFPDFFVYQQAKDIVSGDFYWYYKHNGKSIIAAVDCTGHGVPGAFMSMIGNTLMNEIIIENHELDPGAILTKLDVGISNSLHQDEDSDQQDGMDMALCVIDREKGVMQYSGAKNPMYLISGDGKDGVEEIHADPFSIGAEISLTKKGGIRKFSTREISIEEGMYLYLFTDGYMDQFGHQDMKKFGKSKFQDLLLQNHKLDMDQQKTLLGQEMANWQGDKMQIDDMLVMGIRL